MIANWAPVREQLRAKMLTRGLPLPQVLRADGRWHPCEARGVEGGGAYILSSAMPHLALFTNHADGRGIDVWRAMPQRTLTRAQDEWIADATIRLPPHDLAPPCSCNVIAPTPLSPGALEDAAASAIGSARPTTKLQAAIALLSALLMDEPQRVVHIRERADEVGLGWATMRRAADELRVCAIKEGFAGRGAWWWARGSASKLMARNGSPKERQVEREHPAKA